MVGKTCLQVVHKKDSLSDRRLLHALQTFGKNKSAKALKLIKYWFNAGCNLDEVHIDPFKNFQNYFSTDFNQVIEKLLHIDILAIVLHQILN